MDQSKKTMRHFYCRDVLWETFEQMANDFDCSIDYLVNEAMRYYARSKNYQSPGVPQMTGGQAIPPTNGPAPQGPGVERGYPPTAQQSKPSGNAAGASSPRNQPATSPPPPQQPLTNGPARGRPVPPTPGYAATAGAPAPRGGGGGGAGIATGGPTGHMQQHQQPPPSSPPPNMGAAGPTLFLIYNGQRYPVTKDQFIIGRGSKTSDLAIKDGNISRKHAAVIRRNGTFYIKDLGSTNGIDYKGMRIDNKRIDEGDVFHLCDYELRFTYRAD
jgi:hypothetical protein